MFALVVFEFVHNNWRFIPKCLIIGALKFVGGGAAPVAAAAPAGGAAAAAAPAAEEKKEEVKEESDDDMGFSLFDWGAPLPIHSKFAYAVKDYLICL